ncbi:hypothetical protein ACPCHT_31995 [Nucisporomicrobium flavum]|uniref:hypothetical protein n=1 Tax=Nucisporomicrobium flavum TaxID=2785915 RepID=UPI003C2EECC5
MSSSPLIAQVPSSHLSMSSRLLAFPSLAAPQPSSPLEAGCVPGQDGIPGSWVGQVVCGTWGQKLPAAVWDFTGHRGPLLLAALALLVAAVSGWRAWRRRVWRAHAARACWLQVVPPVSATPAATVDLWRLLATALPAPGRWALRPPRIVWEIEADPHGMRAGLWLPPGVNPTAVLRLLQRAWPGARAEQRRPPKVAGRTARTLMVLPTQPDWLPLVEDTSTANSRTWETAPPDEDRLRAVFDGLAAAGRTGGGLLQVHISRAPAHRMRMLRRATTHPDRTRRARGTARAAGLLADGLRGLILGILSMFAPAPAGSSRRPAHDPYRADLARQARGKLADAPHLLVAVYATGTGPTNAAALAAAADITSGFGLLSAHFTRRRLRRGPLAATQRWVPQAWMSLASIGEAAALAGLPAEPAAHGLPAAASRRRPGGRDLFRAGPAATPHHAPSTPWSAP